MNFVTFNQLNCDIIKNISKIPADTQVLVGIPRSGLLLANILALYMNLPMSDLDSFCAGKLYTTGLSKINRQWAESFEELDNILVIDDSVAGGGSISRAKEKINSCKQLQGKNIKYLAGYVQSDSKKLVDFYFRIIEQPRMFEWNYLHHRGIEKCCFDIDGILCEDPSALQNDDGELYRDFLINAKTKFRPTATIGHLVSSRLEKYRPDTENWLLKNNISFGNLHLLNVKTAKERQRFGCHAQFKAEIYKSLKDSVLFVESEDSQAQEISRLSGKAVFCPMSGRFYEDSVFRKSKANLKIKAHNFMPKWMLNLYYSVKRYVLK